MKGRTKVKMDGILPEDLEELGGPKGEKVEITTLVNAFLAKQDLGILPPKSMQQAVDNFVDKKDTNAMSTSVPSLPVSPRESTEFRMGTIVWSERF